MIVEVEMLAFGKLGEIRKVEIPANRLCEDDIQNNRISIEEALDIVFELGQNDFQPQQHPSVSMGDVVRLNNERYLCCAIGWEKLS